MKTTRFWRQQVLAFVVILLAGQGCKPLSVNVTTEGDDSTPPETEGTVDAPVAESLSLDFDAQELVQQWSSSCTPVSKSPVLAEVRGFELDAYGPGTYEIIV